MTLDVGTIQAGVRKAARKGLLLGAEHVLQVSNQHVPIEEATLERSGRASVSDSDLQAVVSYDTEYAVVQHEDMTFQHDAGRTAKYLENAGNSERDEVLDIIRTTVRQDTGMGN